MASDTTPDRAEKAAGEHGDLPATPGAAARESAHGHTWDPNSVMHYPPNPEGIQSRQPYNGIIRRIQDAGVDEASDESFPASDPPASTHTHAGPPRHG